MSNFQWPEYQERINVIYCVYSTIKDECFITVWCCYPMLLKRAVFPCKMYIIDFLLSREWWIFYCLSLSCERLMLCCFPMQDEYYWLSVIPWMMNILLPVFLYCERLMLLKGCFPMRDDYYWLSQIIPWKMKYFIAFPMQDEYYWLSLMSRWIFYCLSFYTVKD